MGNQKCVANALAWIGTMAYGDGDYARAGALLEESLAISRELGDNQGIYYMLNKLGDVACFQGDFARAEALEEESLALAKELGDRWVMTSTLQSLGWVVYAREDFERARALQEEALKIAWELRHTGFIADGVEYIAQLAATQCEPARAATLFAAASVLREIAGTPMASTERALHEQEAAPARAALGDEAFEAAWAKGRAMILEQAVAYALQPVPSTLESSDLEHPGTSTGL